MRIVIEIPVGAFVDPRGTVDWTDDDYRDMVLEDPAGFMHDSATKWTIRKEDNMPWDTTATLTAEPVMSGPDYAPAVRITMRMEEGEVIAEAGVPLDNVRGFWHQLGKLIETIETNGDPS